MARILVGDCLEALHPVSNGSVSLIVTSPPYADAREKTYGGTSPDEYVDWFLPRADEFRRVLTATGTFILNIKERVVDGVRHRYVRDLVSGMEERGWLLTEEWIWYKLSTTPGKWPNRFRDAWEHLFQFNLQRRFYMDQDAVRVPIGDWAAPRLKRMSAKDRTRDVSATGSGFAKNISNWEGRETVYPDNVLVLASECGNKKHPAAFPVSLPEFFVRLFSRPGDVVLDPFCGSGTTGVAAINLRREFIGVEIAPVYARTAEDNVDGAFLQYSVTRVKI